MANQRWVVYQFRFFPSFKVGDACWTANNITTFCNSPDVAPLQTKYYFSSGAGLNCLASAAFLKVLDMILNLMIQTPTICRDHEEQHRYELLGISDENVEEEDQEVLEPVSK
jgi:hypothetical protein